MSILKTLYDEYWDEAEHEEEEEEEEEGGEFDEGVKAFREGWHAW